MNHRHLILLAIGIIVVVGITYQKSKPNTNGTSYASSMRTEPYQLMYPSLQNPKNLIGLVYPPRIGPLHTNSEFPIKNDPHNRPFVALYDQEPFLVKYGPGQDEVHPVEV